MAQEYEVREEFKDSSLSQLMDASVLCFQGVGDIQSDLLKQYFAISSVQDLANWTQFLWALEIQELALHGGELAHTPFRELPASAQPKFRIREGAQHLTPEQLMMSGVQDLEGLTPAQDLALYDIFRITNIAQLAHNRIMLEARVIQYLHEQSGAAATQEPEPEQRAVDYVLARPQASAATAATQRITEARAAERNESLVAMARETREHVGERLAALRERARRRVSGQAGEEQAPGAAAADVGATPSRLESVRATHQRAGASVAAAQRVIGERTAAIVSRRTTVAGAVGLPRGGLESRRGPGGPAEAEAAGGAGTMSARAAAVLAARGGAAPGGGEAAAGVAGRAAAVLAARGTSAAAAGRAPGAAGVAPGGAVSSGGGAPATRPGAAPAATPTPPQAAPPAPEPGPPSGRRQIPPAVWLAAVALIVLAAILVFVLRTREQPTPSGAPTPGVATQPGAAGQAGVAPQVTAGAGAGAPAGAPGAARTIHTVRTGQSLWRISRHYYEAGHDWPLIYKQNQEQIHEPDLIFPKQRFIIPAKP